MILCSRLETAVQLLIFPQAKKYWRWKWIELQGNGLGLFIWKLVLACHCISIFWELSSAIPNHFKFLHDPTQVLAGYPHPPSSLNGFRTDILHSEKLGVFQKIKNMQCRKELHKSASMSFHSFHKWLPARNVLNKSHLDHAFIYFSLFSVNWSFFP